ncbi:MAG TPA: hypothetical protein VEP89_17005 [Draconibacterium sp.]|nr:hypothetical protein [Draconibacterium sp.]
MRKLFVFIVLLGITIVSCHKEVLPELFNFDLEQEFKLHGNYESNDNSLQFSIVEINDSRCPVDVECVWAGKADVKIDVERPQQGSITLSTYDNLSDTVAGFSFELINVSPYPVSTETTELEDYEVTLRIVQL